MNKKSKAKLMAILTMLSLVGCKKSEIQLEPTESSIIEIVEPETIETTEATIETEPVETEFIDMNGVYYPSSTYSKVNGAAFANEDIEMYNSCNSDRFLVDYIPKYQTMQLLYMDLYHSFVIYNGKVGYVDNSSLTYLPDDYIEVDISDQKVKVVDNNEIVLYCDVVTGKPGMDTNTGYTEVLSKTYNRPMVGPGYRLDVEYCIAFNESEECFHDNRNRSEFGGEIYITNGSHGCVNMKLEDVKVLDAHSEVGTKVVTHK